MSMVKAFLERIVAAVTEYPDVQLNEEEIWDVLLNEVGSMIGSFAECVDILHEAVLIHQRRQALAELVLDARLNRNMLN